MCESAHSMCVPRMIYVHSAVVRDCLVCSKMERLDGHIDKNTVFVAVMQAMIAT